MKLLFTGHLIKIIHCFQRLGLPITIATMEWLIGSFSFVSKRSPKALLSHKKLVEETKT